MWTPKQVWKNVVCLVWKREKWRDMIRGFICKEGYYREDDDQLFSSLHKTECELIG